MAERFSDWVPMYTKLRIKGEIPPKSPPALESLATDPHSKRFLANELSYFQNRCQIEKDYGDSIIAVVEGRVIASGSSSIELDLGLELQGIDMLDEKSTERPFIINLLKT